MYGVAETLHGGARQGDGCRQRVQDQQLVNDTGKEILLNGTEGKGPLDTYAAQIAAFLPSQRR